MSKITPLMTSLHEGHKAEERLKCIDNMLFKKCEDTKDTILQAFWWYRKNSIPLDKIKEAREKIENKIYKDSHMNFTLRQRERNDSFIEVLDILDDLIESEVEE